MINPNKQTSMIVKICFIVLLCTFVKIRCIKGQPDLVGDLYDGTSYGDDDEGAIHILDYEWDYDAEEYVLYIKEVDRSGNILFYKNLNISKGYEYFPVREKLYAIIDSNDYIFSVEEEKPYTKKLVITSNNCARAIKLICQLILLQLIGKILSI